MHEAPEIRPSYPRAPRWRGSDFVVAIAGGFAGAFIGAALTFGSDDTTVLVVSLLLQNVGHIAAVWFLARRRGIGLADMGMVVEPGDGLFLFLGVGLQLALSLLAVPIARWLDYEGSSQQITSVIDPASPFGLQLLLVLSVALIAPIAEELMFRGILYQTFEQRRGFRVAVFGSAAVFATFHLIGLDPDNLAAAALITLPQLFVMGTILANAARRRGRLGVAIFTHAGFNLVAILAVLYTPELVGS